MIKVLMIAKNFELHGITTVILSYALNLNREKIHVDVACGLPVNKECSEKLESNGNKLFVLPSRSKSLFKYKKKLKALLKENHYDIVHVHGNSTTMAVELSVAKKCGVKVRIAHSHNSLRENSLKHKLFAHSFKTGYTKAIACSENAGSWLFGKDNFTILNNGFKTERFKFNEERRNVTRKRLGLEDKFLIGHIGRFNEQKNHPFLLKVFEKVAAKREDAYLLLVGNGPDFDKIKNLIDKHSYKERIIVYGESNSPEDLYNAMDLFVLPSLYEGLPVTLLEAQISGLPCIVSDKITKEVALGDRMSFVSIDNVGDWCNAVNQTQSLDRNIFYNEFENCIRKYDIKNCTIFLEDLYLSLCEGIR